MPSVDNRRSLAGVLSITMLVFGLFGTTTIGADAGPDEFGAEPTGRILLGLGATTFGGLSGNFAEPSRDSKSNPVAMIPSQPVNQTIVRFHSLDLLTRPSSSGLGFSAPMAMGDGYEAVIGNRFDPRRTYVDRAVRVEDVEESRGHRLMPAPRP